MQTKPKITFTPAFFVCWGGLILLEPSIWLGCVAAAMALHETGHLVAIALVGGGVREIRFRAAGMEILRAPGLHSYRADAAVSLAGPICSLIGGTALFSGRTGVAFFGAASLLLGVLNSLPIRTLDGGEALFALLCARRSPESAVRMARVISFLFIIPLWMIAVWIMLITGGNFSLFVLSVCLFASTAFGI